MDGMVWLVLYDDGIWWIWYDVCMDWILDYLLPATSPRLLCCSVISTYYILYPLHFRWYGVCGMRCMMMMYGRSYDCVLFVSCVNVPSLINCLTVLGG